VDLYLRPSIRLHGLKCTGTILSFVVTYETSVVWLLKWGVMSSGYTAAQGSKLCRRKRPWPNLRHSHDIFIEALRKSTKSCQDNWYPGLDSNWTPPECKLQAIRLGPT
jgi:hypothetical protein